MAVTGSLPQRRWVLPEARLGEGTLERELGISPLIAGLLARRGIQTASEAEQFLDPRLQSLGDPFLLTDLRAAAERIGFALAQAEPIAVFGDYDVDGITSAALLTRVLAKLGGHVSAFLPHRVSEGYGLTQAAAERCLAECRPRLLIAVDCGTSSAAEIAWLTAQGVSVIVIDHHELPPLLPACDALVNPHRDAHSTYLASVGLVFKVCHGVLKLDPARREKVDLRHYLDLVALGTVADLVPLRGENRIYVRHGLTRLDQTGIPGLRALSAVAGLRHPASPDDIGFRLGPRLNASGRLDDAGESLRLLLTDDPAEAEALAKSLDLKNRERQDLEQKTFDEALALLAAGFDAEEWGIVLGQRGWHVGVIGIVASRIQRLYGRPTIVIGFDEQGMGKGSGRSVEGCRIVDGLRAAETLLDRFGGHEMAAGLSIREDRLADFRSAFNGWLRRAIEPEALQPRLRLDGELEVGQVDDALFQEIGKLAPFGRENPQPVFAFREVEMSRAPQRIKEKHLKLFLGAPGRGQGCDAIGFGFAERPMPPKPLSIAGVVEWDDYRGRVQLRMIDWQSGNGA